LYVLVRRDLSVPQQAVQAIHAAIEAARRFLPKEAVHPHLVLCGVPDEPTLVREAERLEAFGIPIAKFHEPDRGNELTAIATAPLKGEDRRPMRRYKLLTEV
jgi:hypothetical protein